MNEFDERRLIPFKIMGRLSHLKWLRSTKMYEPKDEDRHIDEMIEMFTQWEEFQREEQSNAV
jgi:hypothetical protein